MPRTIHFERAIFLSWYCALASCKFCYMSTLKNISKDRARRHPASILAEAALCKALGWRIEFLSAGYGAVSFPELMNIVIGVNAIYGKTWLNVGPLEERALRRLAGFVEGVNGSVECIDLNLRTKLCPKKPLEDIIRMFKHCDQLGLKKSITIILGLGEKRGDIPKLIDFISKYDIDRIVFYALKPHQNTIFKKGPKREEALEWLRSIRKAFPDIYIVAGAWSDRIKLLLDMLRAGADAMTKLPLCFFGTEEAAKLEAGLAEAGFEFSGTFTKIRDAHIDCLKESIASLMDKNLQHAVKKRLKSYLSKISKNLKKGIG